MREIIQKLALTLFILLSSVPLYAGSDETARLDLDLQPLLQQLEKDYGSGDAARHIACVGPVTSFKLYAPAGSQVRYDGRVYVVPQDGSIEFVTVRGVDTFSIVRDEAEERHVIRALRVLRLQRKWPWGREMLTASPGAEHTEQPPDAFGTITVMLGGGSTRG